MRKQQLFKLVFDSICGSWHWHFMIKYFYGGLNGKAGVGY